MNAIFFGSVGIAVNASTVQKNLYIRQMEHSDSQKMLYSTSKKDKIFNVRRLPYKQFNNEKFLKSNYSPLLKKDPLNQVTNRQQQNTIGNKRNMEYHYQLAIMGSPAYKELQNKFKTQREMQLKEKQAKLKILKQKEEELQKYVNERRRLQIQNQRLFQKRDQLNSAIQQLRQRREAMQLQQIERNEQQRLMNMGYLKSMMMGMYYQGGLQIDPDNMTYQELLQLEQKIGKVSKGINEEQYQKIEKIAADHRHEGEICSICYENVKTAEFIHQLNCKHIFHCECIKEWLLKEKVCPMCKQQILPPQANLGESQ